MLEQARQLIRKILQADDTPHKIAWGVALGMFIGWTPTVGIQMLIAAAVAWLLRGNKAAAIAVVWITNPYTVVPIYWFNYLIGYWLVGGPWVDWDWFVRLINPKESLSLPAYMAHVYREAVPILWPLWLGSVLIGFFLAVIAYFVTRWGVQKYRSRHQNQALSSASLAQRAAKP